MEHTGGPSDVTTDILQQGKTVEATKEEEEILVDCSLNNITREHVSRVFRGEITTINQTNNTSIVGFSNAEAAQEHDELVAKYPSAIFRPILQFMYSEELNDMIVSSVISTGHHCGIPLYFFIRNQKNHFWEYDSKMIYLRAAKCLRKLGRLVMTLIYRLHKAKICIGGNLLHLILVNGDGSSTPLSLTVMGYHKTPPVFAEGVWDDLYGLRDFVKSVQGAQKFKRSLRGLKPREQNTDDLFDLNMFHKLFPEKRPESPTEEDALDMSYSVCHAPLFWDHKQRFTFCSSYYQLRNYNVEAFDKEMCFEGYTRMDNWHQHPQVIGGIFSGVFKRNKDLYSKKIGLIPFHRNAQVHLAIDSRISLKNQQLRANDVDEDLVKLFPYAIPIAYMEVCKKLLFNKVFSRSFCDGGLVQFFCDGGLDYNRSEMGGR